MGIEGATLIGKALLLNATIASLSMIGGNIMAGGCREIAIGLAANKSLKDISMR